MAQGVPAIGGAPVFYPIALNLAIGFPDREQIDDQVLDREPIDDRVPRSRANRRSDGSWSMK